MNHEKTFAAIKKLQEVKVEMHRLKNALEMANKALEAKREWQGLTYEEIPEQYKNDSVFVEGWLWAEAKLKEKNT